MRSNTLALLAVLTLAGCAGTDPLRADFGESVRQNIAAQTLDPEAGSRAGAALVSDGQKMEQALQDYRKGRPEATREQLIISSGR